jgi:uncharacterized protein YggE
MRHLPLLLAASAALLAPATALAQPQQGPVPMVPAGGPLLSLSVSESVESTPDIATIMTGVQTRALSAKDAMGENAARMERLIAALVKGGVDRKDIQTSGINLAPQYDYANRTEGQGPRFIGYEASNQLSVTVRRLATAGDLVDAMVAAGATNISGPAFGIADPARLLDEARSKAIRTAQARADLYARATGHRGARLVTIVEGGGYAPPMPMVMRMEAAADAAATKIEPGQISSTVSLSLQYVLER